MTAGCGAPGLRDSWLADGARPPPAAPKPAEAAEEFRVQLDGWAADAAWLPGGELLTVQLGGPVQRWEGRSPPTAAPWGDGRHFDALAVSGDGHWVAARDAAGAVHVGGPRHGSEMIVIPPRGEPLSRTPYTVPRPLAAAPSGEWLAIAGHDGSIVLFDPGVGTQLRQIGSMPSAVQDLAVSRDGRWLAACSLDGSVRAWDLQGRAQHWEFRGHRGIVAATTFVDDHTLVTGGHDAKILAWDVRSGRRLAHLESPVGEVQALGVGPRGLWVAGSRAGPHRLPFGSGSELNVWAGWKPLTGADAETFALAVDDSGRVAAGGVRGTVSVW